MEVRESISARNSVQHPAWFSRLRMGSVPAHCNPSLWKPMGSSTDDSPTGRFVRWLSWLLLDSRIRSDSSGPVRIPLPNLVRPDNRWLVLQRLQVSDEFFPTRLNCRTWISGKALST